MPRSDISFPLKDAELREDVHMLGALVGEVIREQGGDALVRSCGAGSSGRNRAPRRQRGGRPRACDPHARRSGRTGARPGARILAVVRDGQHGGEGASHPPPPPVSQRGHDPAGRHRRGSDAAEEPGARARRDSPPDDRDLDRAGLHRASDRVDATHDPAQAAEDRAAAARPPRAVAHRRRDAPDLGPDPQRDHRRLADRGELARAAHRRRRARARAVLHRARSCSRSCRSSTRRSKRRWSRSTARTRVRSSCPRSCASAPGSAATWTAIRT